jgi:uncharacterized radical SAM superfamily Fe-S cluster-containing enzyme
MPATRPYNYLDLTLSICSKCLRKVEAKVVEQDGAIYMHKRCARHGMEIVLLSPDAEYYKLSRGFVKPSEMPKRWNTPIKYGCPYDCGLCPDHEQHSCLTLLEVTDACNLTCPICYAESSPQRQTHRDLATLEKMLDAIVDNEGEPDIVQISGGEPTLHPQFFEILDAARRRPIRHLMLNTNGIRIAREDGFAEKLAAYKPGFEVYLQFDSFKESALRDLRGADLRETRMKALEKLNALNLSTTLVVTLKKGVNDDEAGTIVDFALKQKCVRGVTFQPVQDAGRAEGFDPARDRLTLGEVRRDILAQTKVFKPEDIIPVPCHPDCIAMAYALKTPAGPVALTGMIDPKVLLEGARNTIVFERDPAIRERMVKLFSTNHSPEGAALSLKSLLCCLPMAAAPENIVYDSVFRIIIMQFLDAHNFDVRSVKKSCVHIAHPDGRIIPFDTYNLFYRDGKEKLLESIRREELAEATR